MQLFSQTNEEEYIRKDEPYPAPVSYAGLTEEEAAFIALFEDADVSNLHVYAAKFPQPGEDYYYQGTPISTSFINLLPGKLARLTLQKEGKPHAVISMAGGARELYLVRIPGERWNNQLALFALKNGKLKKLETLAYYECNSRRCVQQDSWLQDVNGDTRMDIIMKKRITRKNGVVKTQTFVKLMNKKWVFKKSRKVDVEEKDYRMEEIKY